MGYTPVFFLRGGGGGGGGVRLHGDIYCMTHDRYVMQHVSPCTVRTTRPEKCDIFSQRYQS